LSSSLKKLTLESAGGRGRAPYLINVQHFVPGLRGELTRRTRDPPSREEEGAKVLFRQQPLARSAVGGSVDKKKNPKKPKKTKHGHQAVGGRRKGEKRGDAGA